MKNPKIMLLLKLVTFHYLLNLGLGKYEHGNLRKVMHIDLTLAISTIYNNIGYLTTFTFENNIYTMLDLNEER